MFAWFMLIASLFLLLQLTKQTTWRDGGALLTQPRFWPSVALGGMVIFAAFHLLGSACSDRIRGRREEVWLWIRSLEYAGWFVVYALVVPYLGYLPTTVIFAVALTLRLGYRAPKMLIAAALSALVIVVLFKTLMKVNLPSGMAYEALPDGLRQIMMTYF
ncbi:tripartite tricarboxylate transporter TctB family protein [Paracoccus fistulariae]|uniref:tripartite tricarboxylate transporter TctB family protein n=1 Tax=Paracoccus fistulariae TaxID=658446 RepID=UPI00232E3F02|nr:tripartite tricarboxylate transporter TctB family protein [Paracoccus fistulariae]MDB6182214.1 tripartite tricarboxylate transporter TctB family protein [Paracoccus fistulariae]